MLALGHPWSQDLHFSGAFGDLDVFLYLEIIVGKALSSLLNPPGDTFMSVEGFIFQDIWMSPS